MDDFELAIERANDDPLLEAAGFRAVYGRLAGLLAAQGVAVRAVA
jgi:hypothetical protein